MSLPEREKWTKGSLGGESEGPCLTPAQERVRTYQNMGYLSEALSARATELADDSAAHGQKRLTGHPACQLSPARSVRAVGEYKVHSCTHLTRPTETSVKVDSDFLYDYTEWHQPATLVSINCSLGQSVSLLEKKKNCSVNSYKMGGKWCMRRGCKYISKCISSKARYWHIFYTLLFPYY